MLKWRDVNTPWGAPAKGAALNLGEVKVLRVFVCHNPLQGRMKGLNGDWLLSLNGEYTRFSTEQEAIDFADAWFERFVEGVNKYAERKAA